jgi:thiol-disulfide isomerase/thioredoxin
MIGLGSIPAAVIIVAGTGVLAWLVACALARRTGGAVTGKAAGGMVIDALFWGLLGARLGYVALWWPEYYAAPASIVAIGDGGFAWWAGVPIAVCWVAWRTRTRRELRRPVLTGVVAGVLVWFAAGAVLDLLQRAAPPLPALQLLTLDEQPVTLEAYQGRPVVLNLWASWCPPCRREMPVLEQAQKAFPDVAFVLVNQGQTAAEASAFLTREGLQLKDVLLDPSSSALQALGARGLPTTLFFDAQGHLVHSHMGELTMASLKHTLIRRLSTPTLPLDP